MKYHIDLHVHTSRYSPCAELLNPMLLGDAMHSKGVHGIVITEHDIMWSKKEIEELNKKFGNLKLYRGIEVSSHCGHFIIIGLDKIDGFWKGMPVKTLLEQAKNKDVAVILVHHHKPCSLTGAPMDTNSLPPGISAIEVASSITTGEYRREAMQIARAKGWVPVAGSDAHCIERVGDVFTSFEELPTDERALANAIMTGKCMYSSHDEDAY